MSSSGDIDYDYKLSCLDDSLGLDLSATCRCNQETWEENYKEWQSPYCMATNRFKDDSRPEEEVIVEEKDANLDKLPPRI